MKCKATKTNGEKCKANATTGSEYCRFHLELDDQELERQAAQAQKDIAQTQKDIAALKLEVSNVADLLAAEHLNTAQRFSKLHDSDDLDDLGLLTKTGRDLLAVNRRLDAVTDVVNEQIDKLESGLDKLSKVTTKVNRVVADVEAIQAAAAKAKNGLAKWLPW